jgi:uncharacterized membrane protein YgcG
MAANSTLQKGEKQLMDYVGLLLLTPFIMFMIAVSLPGCAGKATRTQALLSTDYVAMSNDNLLLYYYQLEDQIVADERVSNDSSVSFGIGTGLFSSGSHFGGGVGMSTGTGSHYTATELRDRRNAVRLELRKRGVDP